MNNVGIVLNSLDDAISFFEVTNLKSHLTMQRTAIEELHSGLLSTWNNQNTTQMSSLFTNDGESIGFDGSLYNGWDEIEAEVGKIFKHHQTANYVWKVKDVRF